MGFSFATFALDVDDLLGCLAMVVPAAIALSALQGYVVASDVPAVEYMAYCCFILRCPASHHIGEQYTEILVCLVDVILQSISIV